MTPRGLIKMTAIANNLEAWRDWNRVEQTALAAGYREAVEQLKPAAKAGWRKIDKARHKLEQIIAA
jgi:hypothetical protein